MTDSSLSSGSRVVQNYHEVYDGLRSTAAAPRERPLAADIESGTLLKLHGARHVARRRLEQALFRPEALRHYEESLVKPLIRAAFEDLRGRKGPGGDVTVNLVEFAERVNTMFIAALIGLDGEIGEAEADELLAIMRALIEGIKVEYSTGDRMKTSKDAAAAKGRFWAKYVEPAYRRRCAVLAAEGPEALPLDLLTVIATVGVDGESWEDDLVLRECCLYLAGGGATTAAVIAHAVYELERWFESHGNRDLVYDDEFLRRAVDETTRLFPPAVAVMRVADSNISTGCFRAETGESLYLDLVAANRDAGVFGADAASFDPTRVFPTDTWRYGVAFGAGRHLCIGKPLAAGEADVAGTVGISCLLVRACYDAGVRLDSTRTPTRAESLDDRFTDLPVIFTSL